MTRYKQTECPNCDSSDAFTVYDDGGYCFSCNYSTKKVTIEMTDFEPITSTNTRIQVSEIADLNSFAMTSRGISKQS